MTSIQTRRGGLTQLFLGCCVMALWGSMASLSFAGTSSNCGSCQGSLPSCSNQSPIGVDSCGNACNMGWFNNYCQAPDPVCGGLPTTGTYVCGGACTKPVPACGGGLPVVDPWQPYGIAVPGHPVYGFPQATDIMGNPLLPSNNTKNLLGLAAKGNIVLGDYTRDTDGDGATDFKERGVLDLLQPKSSGNPNGKTQPYVVDPTDDELGYENAPPSACNGHSPCFDGNYTQVDEDGDGKKLRNGGARKFYESSLPDDEFKALVDPTWRVNPTSTGRPQAVVDAVLYTNHALTGYVPHGIVFFGSTVARDDALVSTGNWLEIFHDTRLLGRDLRMQITLPMGIKRPRLIQWKEGAP